MKAILNSDVNLSGILKAALYASEKHALQRRKGNNHIPYINHLIRVCKITEEVLPDIDEEVLQAALLHDVLEDTHTTAEEIESIFGARVRIMVEQMTDDNSLPKSKRKEEQIRKAPSLWPETKVLKIADKIANIHDIITYPLFWTKTRKINYVKWSAKVVGGCRGENDKIEKLFDNIAAQAMLKFKG